MSKQTIGMIVPIAVLFVLWFLPTPQGLSLEGWHFLAIFLAVIIGLVIEPVPAALVGLVGISVVALLGLAGKTPAGHSQDFQTPQFGLFLLPLCLQWGIKKQVLESASL